METIVTNKLKRKYVILEAKYEKTLVFLTGIKIISR